MPTPEPAATALPIRPDTGGGDRFRVGIDIGGTFTDCVVVDRGSGAIMTMKVPTVPADPSVGFLNALERALARHAVPIEAIGFLAHGTTVATNTIIQDKGARVGLIASAGFSDVLEIAYQTRTNLFDLFYEKPKPLVPRRLTRGVPERIGPDGEVLTPLDRDAVAAAARELRDAGAAVIVVAFLHAYRFPEHERAAGAAIAEACPGLPVVLSHDVCPEYREYPRTSTAVVNATLLPAVGDYIGRLEARLGDLGARAGLHLMTSAGGVTTARVARRHPVQLIESGPAATVAGAQFIAESAGFRDIIVFDMGGTTAKVAPVTNGAPRVAEQFEVGPMAVASDSARRGLGYPVRTPVVEMIEVSAGGGSIAALDPGGALTVGPESMGADPGPACYGRDGERPTITDANLVLGRLDPDYFLGGETRLDRDRAIAAIERQLARPLGMSVDAAAEAVVEIGTAKMAAALRLATIRRGIDPRRYVMVACGGGGPLHAASIARQVGMARVLIPPAPGLTSALGLLATDLKHDFARALMMRTDAIAPAELDAALGEMRADAAAILAEESIAPGDMTFRATAELRYVGQSFHLGLPVPDGPVDAATLPALHQAFHKAHQATYGFAAENEPTMVVNLRLTASGTVARPAVPKVAAGGSDPGGALKGSRPVHFRESGGRVDCPIYERDRLEAGNRIEGPAIIEQMDTTTLVPPGARLVADPSGVLIMTIDGGASQ